MLVTAEEMLKKAKAGKYAVGQFNINNLEWTKAILATAQELQSPVILGVSEGAGKYMTGFGTVAAMVKAMNPGNAFYLASFFISRRKELSDVSRERAITRNGSDGH